MGGEHLRYFKFTYNNLKDVFIKCDTLNKAGILNSNILQQLFNILRPFTKRLLNPFKMFVDNIYVITSAFCTSLTLVRRHLNSRTHLSRQKCSFLKQSFVHYDCRS